MYRPTYGTIHCALDNQVDILAATYSTHIKAQYTKVLMEI